MNLQDWIGRSEQVTDLFTATPYAALSATFDRPAERPANHCCHAGHQEPSFSGVSARHNCGSI